MNALARSGPCALRATRRQLQSAFTRRLHAPRALWQAQGKDESWKKWRGADEWKNWVDWDSKYRDATDELNRMRHYFWHIDAKGRLFRRELDQGDRSFGEMKHPPFLDFFFSHMQHNDTGLYLPQYPYLSYRMHERYYAKCELAPIVFRDLLAPAADQPRHRLLYGATLTEVFDPSALRISKDGVLFHPVQTKAQPAAPETAQATLYGVIEVQTAQRILETAEMDDSDQLLLVFQGKAYRLPLAP